MFRLVVSPPESAAKAAAARPREGAPPPAPAPQGKGGPAPAGEGAVTLSPPAPRQDEGEGVALNLFANTKTDRRGFLLPPARLTQLDTVMPAPGAPPLASAGGEGDPSWGDVMDAVLLHLASGSGAP